MQLPNVNWTRKIRQHSTIEPSSEQFGNKFIVHVLLFVLHCSKLLLFWLLFLVINFAQISEGRKSFSLSILCLCWLSFFSANFVHLCLSHTGQLSSLYRACVIFSTRPSDHCDRQCVSYALNKNESMKKEVHFVVCTVAFNVSYLILCESKGLFSI